MINRISLKWFLTGVVILLALFWLLYFCQKSKRPFSNPTQESESYEESLEPRPDVLDWIEKHYGSDPKRKMAMLRLAEADQYILVFPDDITKASELNSLAEACYAIAFRGDRPTIEGEPIFDAISTQTFNTWERARTRNAYLGRLSGRVLQLHEVQSWEKECAQPLPR